MIDLHCHTRISDGSLTMREVIQLAKKQGITHLAITDHDTTKGLPDAVMIGEEYDVQVVPGIEISAYDYVRNRSAHILGYYVTPGHEAIASLCDPLLEQRHYVSYEMVKKIQKAGYNISWEQVSLYAEYGTAVYKQHIMHALIEKGYTDRIYGDLYYQLFHKGETKETSGIAHIPIRYIDAIDAIQAIRNAGGIPVLAHPKQFNNFPAIPEWVEKGLEGIEVKHPLHSPEDEKRAIHYAETFNLIKTGGSDFHGEYGDNNYSLGSRHVGLNEINELLDRRSNASADSLNAKQ